MMRLRVLLVCTMASLGICAAGCSDESFATVSDASTADASSSDASSSDASSSDASSSDAFADAGGPVKFCDGLVPAPALCADFDRGEPAEFGWSRRDIQPQGSGTLAIDTAQSRSAPASLLFRSMHPSEGNSTNLVGRDFDVSSEAKIALEYDLLVEDFANAFSVQISTLKFVEPGHVGDYLVIFTAKTGAAALEERMPPSDGGPSYNAVSALRFPIVAKWTHVAIVVDLKKVPSPTLKIDLDGQPAIAERALTEGYLRGFTQLGIGMPYVVAATGSVALRVDNVVLRIEP